MHKWLPFILFVIILGAARILGAITPDDLPNLQPFGALFFCGMAFFGVKWLWAPALAWFLTYPLTSALNGYALSAQLLVPLLGFIAIVAFAKFFKGKSLRKIFFGSLGAALVFYLLTNTLSWALNPSYAKSLGGWSQALFTGLPGFPPTWTFFRNSLISQAVFTGAFMLAHANLPALLPQKLKQASGA
jgi:multisubunit Na+/H+ antiporter MnhF subunit